MPNKHHQPVITIDGTSASGKSSLSEVLAHVYGARRIEAGIFFRMITLHLLKHEDPALHFDPQATTLTPAQIAEAVAFAETITTRTVDQAKRAEAVYSPLVSTNVAKISSVEQIHARVDDCLRAFIHASKEPVVIEGRTMGKYVFPQADVKLYIDADINVCAERRFAKMQKQGYAITLDQVRADLKARDDHDQNRAYEPTGYDYNVHHMIMTTKQTVEQTTERAMELIEKAVPHLKNRRENIAQRSSNIERA